MIPTIKSQNEIMTGLFLRHWREPADIRRAAFNMQMSDGKRHKTTKKLQRFSEARQNQGTQRSTVSELVVRLCRIHKARLAHRQTGHAPV